MKNQGQKLPRPVTGIVGLFLGTLVLIGCSDEPRVDEQQLEEVTSDLGEDLPGMVESLDAASVDRPEGLSEQSCADPAVSGEDYRDKTRLTATVVFDADSGEEARRLLDQAELAWAEDFGWEHRGRTEGGAQGPPLRSNALVSTSTTKMSHYPSPFIWPTKATTVIIRFGLGFRGVVCGPKNRLRISVLQHWG